jgi:hypothetical protein
MNSEDEFNDFVVSDLIDLSSSEDEEKFYSDATDIIIAHESLNEPRRGGSIIRHEAVDRKAFVAQLTASGLFLKEPYIWSGIFQAEISL